MLENAKLPNDSTPNYRMAIAVSHYLDKNGLECDAVVHLRNGTYGLVEIKLGGDAEAAVHGCRAVRHIFEYVMWRVYTVIPKVE